MTTDADARREWWSKEDDAFIEEHVQLRWSYVQMGEFLNRSPDAVRTRLKRLKRGVKISTGVTARGRFSPEEDATVRQMLQLGHRAPGIARRLGRALKSVETAIIRLKREDAEAEHRAAVDARMMELAQAGLTSVQISEVIGLHPRMVSRRVSASLQSVRWTSAAPAPQEVLAAQCDRHAEACLSEGGFWSLSERALGGGKFAVCLPLIPPAQTLRRAA